MKQNKGDAVENSIIQQSQSLYLLIKLLLHTCQITVFSCFFDTYLTFIPAEAMHQSLYSFLSTSAIVFLVFTSPTPCLTTTFGITLKPIPNGDFEAATGLQYRQHSKDFSDLNLYIQSQLIYRSPGS